MEENQTKQAVKNSGSFNAKSNIKGNLGLVRSMPESLAAEAAVLGSMIIDPECIGFVVEIIDRNSFYRIEHQHIFDALLSLYEKNKGQGIDAVLLRDELTKSNLIDEIG